uniref:SUEL-type lectin domain-containing protein n=1 Tax=Chromera velia CCMP2878 TaxID=1169474 RepID=A0A0G4EZI6_9ALVE|eukprot:Cvel_14332.t1-p1 / transcript=Cvel_14332.t1 / gene=Cvel_14332 / organism=Chromera_velia_CCMP2878 / gene_product=hypothetical protein / transcript_product=hypothetical protein / location=Cvel_scaffold1014:56091-58351(+) / protein_length=621 / sequence_SO=supercontig / SO=protein_coding / is_pseudo=false
MGSLVFAVFVSLLLPPTSSLFSSASSAQPQLSEGCISALPSTSFPAEFVLECQDGRVITAVSFASYGKPSGDCTDPQSEFVSVQSGPSQSMQMAADRNAGWLVDSWCYGRRKCEISEKTIREYVSKNVSNVADLIFGDPAPLTSKWLTVKVNCGRLPDPSPPVPESQRLWSADPRLNPLNFNSTLDSIAALYDVLENCTAPESILSRFEALQLDVWPTAHKAHEASETGMLRWVSLWALQTLGGADVFGLSSAWFGLIAPLRAPFNDTHLMTFRGTMSVRDVVYDADITFEPLSRLLPNVEAVGDAAVHRGLLELYMCQRSTVLASFRDLSRGRGDGKGGKQGQGQQRLIITGHSAGCGLALFSLLDLLWGSAFEGMGGGDEGDWLSLHSLYVYGCPRLGNVAFVNFFRSSLETRLHVRHGKVEGQKGKERGGGSSSSSLSAAVDAPLSRGGRGGRAREKKGMEYMRRKEGEAPPPSVSIKQGKKKKAATVLSAEPSVDSLESGDLPSAGAGREGETSDSVSFSGSSSRSCRFPVYIVTNHADAITASPILQPRADKYAATCLGSESDPWDNPLAGEFVAGDAEVRAMTSQEFAVWAHHPQTYKRMGAERFFPSQAAVDDV